MRAGDRPAATRMNLLRARRQLERVDRGAELIRRKREALVKELFQLARPAADARALIAEEFARAIPALLGALASHGHAGLRALGWPARDYRVEIRAGQVWGISVSDIVERPPARRSPEARGAAPGSAGPAVTEAAARFEALAELLLEAAPRELRMRRLGDAVSRTSRQVHALEQRVAPRLTKHVRYVERTLEEREREEHLRLKYIRDRRSRATSHDASGAF